MYGDVSYRDQTYVDVTYGDVTSLYPSFVPTLNLPVTTLKDFQLYTNLRINYKTANGRQKAASEWITIFLGSSVSKHVCQIL